MRGYHVIYDAPCYHFETRPLCGSDVLFPRNGGAVGKLHLAFRPQMCAEIDLAVDPAALLKRCKTSNAFMSLRVLDSSVLYLHSLLLIH